MELAMSSSTFAKCILVVEQFGMFAIFVAWIIFMYCLDSAMTAEWSCLYLDPPCSRNGLVMLDGLRDCWCPTGEH